MLIYKFSESFSGFRIVAVTATVKMQYFLLAFKVIVSGINRRRITGIIHKADRNYRRNFDE